MESMVVVLALALAPAPVVRCGMPIVSRLGRMPTAGKYTTRSTASPSAAAPSKTTSTRRRAESGSQSRRRWSAAGSRPEVSRATQPVKMMTWCTCAAWGRR